MKDFLPPQQIEIVSDGNIMKFKETYIPREKSGKILYYYKYVKSDQKLGLITGYTEKEITDNIRKEIFKVI